MRKLIRIFLLLISFSNGSKAQDVPDSLFALEIFNACPSCIELSTQNLLPNAYNLDRMIWQRDVLCKNCKP